MKKIEELRKLDHKDLQEELKQASIKSFQVKFPVKNNESNNSHLVRKYRRYIAQIKTLLKEKSAVSESK
ncbi:50S ribosomal protein L29 [Candidatus Peregrinibacteria bacterium HGW-Peregrinibacteria-1]|jgi:large subunit ribosomal protein L29|nr:MAG: 50S ribosomal protein L29 [Candidatus Peregrinibacteria bacterium HGW-Peregrinibacteria-1]